MQTFLPYPSFIRTAEALDYRRLGKQRSEAWQILKILLGYSSAWEHHPAVLQWHGHIDWLCLYAITCCDEWLRRGYVDNMRPRFAAIMSEHKTSRWPWWLGVEQYHASHRANLLRKDYHFYYRYRWVESPDMPYYWPTHRRADA